jgi:hypothetical protein
MTLLPAAFLVRMSLPCPYVKDMPRDDKDELLDLPAANRIDTRARLSTGLTFADVRIGWNELGLGLQVQVHGKDEPPQGDAARPRGSDGVTLWLDTRDTRTIHRASKYCHQFFFLPTGGGPERDQPAAGQLRIHRAQQDAPLVGANQFAFQAGRVRGGYRLHAFLPAAALYGYDPENHPRLGFYYSIRDTEKGEQTLGLGPEFPFWEDPSLWSTLELVRDTVGEPGTGNSGQRRGKNQGRRGKRSR